MADTKGGERGSQQSLQTRGASQDRVAANPISLVRRMSDEMDRAFDRLFEDFGFITPRSMMGRSASSSLPDITAAAWAPQIEAFQDQDKFIVRAELPGLNKDDVEVSITDDAITLQGQRKQERNEQREGFYHSERSYGTFYRSIPLPEGAIADSAQATFRDGMLEVRVQAPPHEVTRSRKIEIGT
jgi:HSP20 family protein